MGLKDIYRTARNALIGLAALTAVSIGLDSLLQRYSPVRSSQKNAVVRSVYAQEKTDEKTEELKEILIRQYSQKVYQNPKPVIVLHSGIGREGAAIPPSNRMRKVLIEVQKKYAEQICFYEFKWENFLPLSDNLDKSLEYKEWFYDERFHKGMELEQITGHPSTWMYHRINILTSEHSETNKLIDIIRGGPKSDEWAMQWVKDIPVYWIDSNIFGIPNPDKKLFRFNNTGNYQKVGDLK